VRAELQDTLTLQTEEIQSNPVETPCNLFRVTGGSLGDYFLGGQFMHITDPIADMLTRVRNANSAKHTTVDVPASNMKKSIAKILLEEGYIKNYQLIDDGTQGIIRITLKYNGSEKAISGLRRVSKPGLRIYAGAEELPKVLGGLGIAIVSTSKGVMTDKAARKAHVGGEVLAFVW
jgi:small subunit ribosomal protein S8